MSVKYFETHTHLDYIEDQAIFDLTLRECENACVSTILTIAVSPDNQSKVLEIAERAPYIYTTQGIHPHEAQYYDVTVEEEILKNLHHPKVVAIGEIGLDYHYDLSPRETQRRVFEQQLSIAEKSKLPVVIHTREADEDTIAIIRNFRSTLSQNCVMHSYSSGSKLAEVALELGFYFGFNGMVTFKAAENVRDIVRMIPLENILLETDAPYLAPVPFRGKTNYSYYLPTIAQKIAELKNESLEKVANTTFQNGMRLFNL